jgi:hypothetical protein
MAGLERYANSSPTRSASKEYFDSLRRPGPALNRGSAGSRADLGADLKRFLHHLFPYHDHLYLQPQTAHSQLTLAPFQKSTFIIALRSDTCPLLYLCCTRAGYKFGFQKIEQKWKASTCLQSGPIDDACTLSLYTHGRDNDRAGEYKLFICRKNVVYSSKLTDLAATTVGALANQRTSNARNC